MGLLWSYAICWINDYNRSTATENEKQDLIIQSPPKLRPLSTKLDDMHGYLLQSLIFYRSCDNPSLNLRLQKDRCTWIGLLSKTNAATDSRLLSFRESAQGRILIIADRVLSSNFLSFELIIHRRKVREILLSTARNPSSKWQYLNLSMISWCLFMNPLILRLMMQNDRCDIWKALIAAWIRSLLASSVSHHINDFEPLRSAFLLSQRYWDIEHWGFAFECGLQTFIDKIADYSDSHSLSGVLFVIQSRLYALNYRGRAKMQLGKYIWPPLSDADAYFQMVFHGHDGLWGISLPSRYPLFEIAGKEVTAKEIVRDQSEKDKRYENKCGWPPCSIYVPNDDIHQIRTWKCSRCRLIRYCCKNHQKKHWKFIHRQQCREFRF